MTDIRNLAKEILEKEYELTEQQRMAYRETLTESQKQIHDAVIKVLTHRKIVNALHECAHNQLLYGEYKEPDVERLVKEIMEEGAQRGGD